MFQTVERNVRRARAHGVLKAHAARPAGDIDVALPGVGRVSASRREDRGDEVYGERNFLFHLLGEAEHLPFERAALFAAVHIFVDVTVKFVVRPSSAVAFLVALGNVVFQPLRGERRDLPARNAPRADTVPLDQPHDAPRALARDERLTDAHGGVGVVYGAVRRKFHAQLLRHRAQPELTGEALLRVHIKELRIVEIEAEGRELVAARFEVEVVHVVERRVTEHDMILIFEERLDARIRRGKGRIGFEILVLVGKNKPLPPLAVGEVELPLGVEENILALQDVELLVREHIPEGADLRHALKDAGALDVEKDVLHLRGRIFSAPPMYGRRTSGISTLPSALRWFSRNAMSILGGATTVLLRVCAKLLPFSPL